jgi:hypothetical protein
LGIRQNLEQHQIGDNRLYMQHQFFKPLIRCGMQVHQIQFLGTSESNLKTNRDYFGVEVPTVSE